LRDSKPAVNTVRRNPESIEVRLKQPVGMIERFRPLGRIDQRQHGPDYPVIDAARDSKAAKSA
jgi:hypothetical protein